MRRGTARADFLRATVLGGGLALLAWSLLNRYSGVSPWEPYRDRLQGFVRAAVAGDSSQLRTLTTSEAPVRWALTVAHQQPAILRILAGKLSTTGGDRRADTTVVLFYSSKCSDKPFEVTFVGHGRSIRLHEVRTDCSWP